METLALIVGTIIGAAGFGFGIFQFLQRKKDEQMKVRITNKELKNIAWEEKQLEAQSAENRYRGILKRELQKLGLAGAEFASKFLPFDRTFVSLRLSPVRSYQEPPNLAAKNRSASLEMIQEQDCDLHLSPEQVMAQAFQNYQLLVVIGDPGAGKTTLLQYYAVTCLEGNQLRLGFRQTEILPFYFPLRELKFADDIPHSLQDSLASWSGLMHQDIAAAEFKAWLENNDTLVLLDGLDEISDRDKRKQVCQWVKLALGNFERARFVLTSRPTGMRKLEGIELECDYQKAEILDFSPQQQECFLKQWFNTLYLKDPAASSAGVPAEQKSIMEKKAADRAQAIFKYLNEEDNKSIRQLARTPMMLQIMAILWEEHDYLPRGRCHLYDVSLNYLLECRDDRRKLKPLLPAENVRSILAPVALRMLESEKSEFILKYELHDWVQVFLQKMKTPPDARLLCENLRDRAGLITDYGADHYIFRHKSFMEFLAAVQLVEECKEDPERMQRLVESFKDEDWEEPLRFFIGKAGIKLFDRFMQYFFQSEVSRDLDSNKQTLLENLVREAPFREIDSMVQYLDPAKANDRQIRYILNCLKIIDTPESIGAVVDFLKEKKGDAANLDLAGQIAAEMGPKHGLKIAATIQMGPEQEPGMMTSNYYMNSFEDNAVYIKIPGGAYKFSVTGKMEIVPDLYFCKYLVTNKRYRKFIAYLEGKEKPLEGILPLQEFSGKFLQLAGTIKYYQEYIGQNPREWGDKFRSRYDEDKKFNGEDQPVVGVNWYGAHAYCFWLSCLQGRDNLYRLPNEVEWEWAAGGKERREYPWPKDKGEPSPELANYGENVGATTPVGRYPEGATPEGLMDMAGNAWEWMANWHGKDEKCRALRGGSWFNPPDLLRCAARGCAYPTGDFWLSSGFRVVCEFSPSHT